MLLHLDLLTIHVKWYVIMNFHEDITYSISLIPCLRWTGNTFGGGYKCWIWLFSIFVLIHVWTYWIGLSQIKTTVASDILTQHSRMINASNNNITKWNWPYIFQTTCLISDQPFLKCTINATGNSHMITTLLYLLQYCVIFCDLIWKKHKVCI